MVKMRALVEAAARNAVHDDDTPAPESADELAARAENISMSALTRKGMSSWEMADRLRSRDLDETTVLNEVARLEGVGLLDDLELAETLVRTLQDRKGLGRSGITAELRRRHVDADAIEAALDALDGDDEIARASEIAIKRAPQLRSLDNVTAKRRLSAFLMRKGYSGSVISAAVAAALEPSGPRFR
jgi:regulatory protein